MGLAPVFPALSRPLGSVGKSRHHGPLWAGAETDQPYPLCGVHAELAPPRRLHLHPRTEGRMSSLGRILVTGADGFIGSHLVEALSADGHSVRALVQYNIFNSWGWLDQAPDQ